MFLTLRHTHGRVHLSIMARGWPHLRDPIDGGELQRRWDIDEKKNENNCESGGNIVTNGEHSIMSSKLRWDDDVSTSLTVEGGGATAAKRQRKRWDETPVVASGIAAGGRGAPPDTTPLAYVWSTKRGLQLRLG